MVIAINPNEVRDYVLKAERQADGSPAPGATIFKMRSIPLAVRSRFNVVLGLAASNTPAGTDLLSQVPASDLVDLMLDALRTSLCGWQHLKDGQGKEVAFASEPFRLNGQVIQGAPTNQTLDSLPPEAAEELSLEALMGMTLSRADAKNL